MCEVDRLEGLIRNCAAEVESLVKKSSFAEKSEDAMRFAQASLNAANAMLALDQIKRNESRSLSDRSVS